MGNNEVAVFSLARSLPNDLWGVFCAGVIKTEGVRDGSLPHRLLFSAAKRIKCARRENGALQMRCGGVVYGSSRN